MRPRFSSTSHPTRPKVVTSRRPPRRAIPISSPRSDAAASRPSRNCANAIGRGRSGLPLDRGLRSRASISRTAPKRCSSAFGKRNSTTGAAAAQAWLPKLARRVALAEGTRLKRALLAPRTGPRATEGTADSGGPGSAHGSSPSSLPCSIDQATSGLPGSGDGRRRRSGRICASWWVSSTSRMLCCTQAGTISSLSGCAML